MKYIESIRILDTLHGILIHLVLRSHSYLKPGIDSPSSDDPSILRMSASSQSKNGPLHDIPIIR